MRETSFRIRVLRITPLVLTTMAAIFFPGCPLLASDPHSAYYSADDNNLFWFIQITDVHIGMKSDQDRQNLQWVVTEGKNVINPSFIVVSGDLTDSTDGNLLGYPDGPHQSEWDEYKAILQNNVDASFYYDIPGNHDHYNDPYFDYYLANSIQGQATNQTQLSWIKRFPFGKYHFLGINTADNSGSSFSLFWPYGDYAGLDSAELAFISTKLQEHTDAKLTMIFGHHPLTATGNPFDTYVYYGGEEFVALMDSYASSLYGYGHTHDYSEKFFTQNMSEGVFYLNVASLGKSSENNFSVIAVDCNGISIVTHRVEDWPLVLITTPMDGYLGGVANPYSYTVPNGSWNPIRALVFDKNTILSVQYRIDNDNLWFPMSKVATNPHLWQALWDASGLKKGEHDIEVEAITMSGSMSKRITVFVERTKRPNRKEPLPIID